jgi:hypothetical protein
MSSFDVASPDLALSPASSHPPSPGPTFDLFRALMSLAETHPEVFQKIYASWSTGQSLVLRGACKRSRVAVNAAVQWVELCVADPLLDRDLADVFPHAKSLRLDTAIETCAGAAVCPNEQVLRHRQALGAAERHWHNAGHVGQWLGHLADATPRLLQQLERVDVCVRDSHVDQGILPGEIAQLLSRCACLVLRFCWHNWRQG